MISKYTYIIKETQSFSAALEYNADITIKQFGDRIANVAQRDNLVDRKLRELFATEKPVAEDPLKQEGLKTILKQFEEADPTKNKAYVPFFAKLYATGGWGAKIEDIQSKISPAIEQYIRLKQKNLLKPEHKDILQFKAFDAFLDAVESYGDILEEKSAALDAAHGKATQIYEDNTVRIIIPYDETAACYYGQGTRWCTAAKNNNYFSHYSKQGDLYILLPKQPEYNGEKYQLHFQSSQFMDEKDNSVKLDTIISQRFPVAGEVLMEHEESLRNNIDRIPGKALLNLLNEVRQATLDQFDKVVMDSNPGDTAMPELIAARKAIAGTDLNVSIIKKAMLSFPARAAVTLDYEVSHVGNTPRYFAFILKYNQLVQYLESTNAEVKTIVTDALARVRKNLKLEFKLAPGSKIKKWAVVER